MVFLPKPRLGALAGLSLLFASGLAAAPAHALTLEVKDSGPSLVGQPHALTATVSEAVGSVKYEWRFGDADDYEVGPAENSHSWAAPGHYPVDVVATDESGESASAFFQHLVHYPLTPARPTSSAPIVYDAARKRVYSVNQDNDTVTSLDAAQLVKLAEVPVYRRPEALAIVPDGKLWVVNQDDYAITVVNLDTFSVESGFRLPYASQPAGIAVSPTGDAVYVTLMAVGKLLKLDPTSRQVLGEADVGGRPRGLTISHDGSTVYVARFIASDDGGEIVKVDAATLTVAARVPLKLDTETLDSPQAARGVPNYLFSVALTPDGRQAWIPGKKDNIVRGPLRDGQRLTHESMVRPLVSIIDALADAEIYASRVDLDDRSLPVHVEFTPFGNLAIVTLGGSNRVEIRDVSRPTQVFSAINDAGAFPRASVLAPDGRLFVQSWLGREVLVYDLTALVNEFDQSTPRQIAKIATVAQEKLTPQLLRGAQLFHDSSDPRMGFEGYLSCGVCHFEGKEDGRTYDFSQRGEGLRNTIALVGRGGTGHGRVNWTGTFDEIQDFEHEIRDLFGGKGFLTDDVFTAGGHELPLGTPKAGLDADLDALSAFVASFERVSPSPYRSPDGSLTAAGVAGKTLYAKLGCDFCHGGAQFTDSASNLVHDVGTIGANSGKHAGGPLDGFDSPTLLGVWETAPYLHDGSAKTLRDVLTVKNPGDLHGYVSHLSPEQLDQLVAYLEQLDGDPPLRPLPFEPPLPAMPMGGNGGQPSGGGGASASGGQPNAGGTAPNTGAPPAASDRSSRCSLSQIEPSRLPLWPLIAALLLRARRQKGARSP